MSSAPRLTDSDIDKAIELLSGWTGKLTWRAYLVILAMELPHGHVYSKVAMLKQPRIKDAWNIARARLADDTKDAGEKRYGSSAVGALRRKLDETREELRASKALNNELLEQFQRWQFNAERHRLKLSQLDAPLVDPRAPAEKKIPY